jgi:hypothetical protein
MLNQSGKIGDQRIKIPANHKDKLLNQTMYTP